MEAENILVNRIEAHRMQRSAKIKHRGSAKRLQKKKFAIKEQIKGLNED